jgi:hypothetical protein
MFGRKEGVLNSLRSKPGVLAAKRLLLLLLLLLLILISGHLEASKPWQRKTMIMLSLNIRGVGGTLKSASFRRFLNRTTPDIVFLQETLVAGSKVRNFLNNFRPTWHTATASSSGTLGGLAVTWDPTMFTLVPYLCCGGILLTSTSLWNAQPITLLNMYGPCSDRKLFLGSGGRQWPP